MDLANAVEQIRGSTWLDKLASLREKQPTLRLSNAEIHLIAREVHQNLRKGRVGKARDWLSLALYFDPMPMMAQIQRLGILRLSKYGYESSALKRFLREVSGRANKLNLPLEITTYLDSISTFLNLSSQVQAMHWLIVRTIRGRHQALIKSSVASIERLCSRPPVAYRSGNSDQIGFYYFEECTDALSFVISQYAEIIGISRETFVDIDEAGLQGGVYHDLIIAACKMRAYQESELLIDIFAFRASAEGKNVRISPSDPNLERSIRLGYIQTSMQTNQISHNRIGQLPEDIPSLADLIQQVTKVHIETLVRFVEKPVARYVLMYPDAAELFDVFRDDALFGEEVILLERLAKEQYCRPGELLRTSLAPGLTIRDVLKIQRWMSFLCEVMMARLRPLLETNDAIGLRSLVPVFKKPKLVELLARCAGYTAAERFINLASYGSDERASGVFDVQYRPLIASADYVLLPINIFSASNLVRNMLFQNTEGRKAKDPNPDISMQHILAECLRSRFEMVAENTKLSIGSQILEIDIVVCFNDKLLVMECKSSFHPCSIFELRTSYDHLVTAGRQLDRSRQLLQSEEARQLLAMKLKWPCKPISTVMTCIATANRMFNGYRLRGHPVRQAYEMINILTGGTVVVGSAEYRVWKNPRFSCEDLESYLGTQSLHASVFEAMNAAELTYEFGTAALSRETFVLDGERLQNSLDHVYQRVSSTETISNI